MERTYCKLNIVNNTGLIVISLVITQYDVDNMKSIIWYGQSHIKLSIPIELHYGPSISNQMVWSEPDRSAARRNNPNRTAPTKIRPVVKYENPGPIGIVDPWIRIKSFSWFDQVKSGPMRSNLDYDHVIIISWYDLDRLRHHFKIPLWNLN